MEYPIQSQEPLGKTSSLAKATPSLPLRDTFSLSNPRRSIELLLTSPAYFTTVATLLLLAESVLCLAIIRFVPCKSWPGQGGEVWRRPKGRMRKGGERSCGRRVEAPGVRLVIARGVNVREGTAFRECAREWRLHGCSCRSHVVTRRVLLVALELTTTV